MAVRSFVERGDSLSNIELYAQAVIAYGEALKLDPDESIRQKEKLAGQKLESKFADLIEKADGKVIDEITLNEQGAITKSRVTFEDGTCVYLENNIVVKQIKPNGDEILYAAGLISNIKYVNGAEEIFGYGKFSADAPNDLLR